MGVGMGEITPINMSRKRYKNKKCSCALCKPHKRGWAKRIDGLELQKLKEDEKDIHLAKMGEMC
jgi:hypothetical protein